MSKNDFTTEPQSSQSKDYFIRIPEGGILIKNKLFDNATATIFCPPWTDGFFGEGLVDSYFPPSQRKIRNKYKLCALGVFRERSERAVNTNNNLIFIKIYVLRNSKKLAIDTWRFQFILDTNAI